MANWNDDRLDKRDEEVKEGFTRLEGAIKESAAASERRFEKIDERLAQTATRQELKDGITELRSEMNKGFAENECRLHGLDAYVARQRRDHRSRADRNFGHSARVDIEAAF